MCLHTFTGPSISSEVVSLPTQTEVTSIHVATHMLTSSIDHSTLIYICREFTAVQFYRRTCMHMYTMAHTGVTML